MASFRDIPRFTRSASYSVDVSWRYLHHQYTSAIVEDRLDINPDFQRMYVWTPKQKSRYVEFILRGGMTGRDLYFNCPGWRSGRIGHNYPDGWYVLVDGKQRLDTVLGFMNNEVPVFDGLYYRDFSDHPDMTASFKWHVNDLATYEEVLQWYLDLNIGGTVHSDDEISRVKALLQSKPEYRRLSQEEINAQSRLDRGPIQEALQELEAEKIRTCSLVAQPSKKSRRKT